MKKYVMVELKDGNKTGNKITLSEEQYLKLNLTAPFKVFKNKEIVEIAACTNVFIQAMDLLQ